MKLGIAMLLIGLLCAGFGVFLGNAASSAISYGEAEHEEVFLYESAAWGLLVFGGGLSIGGIVRMIVKR